MAKTLYRIDRIIPGGFRDSLRHLWEGEDLPTFAQHSPYLFESYGEAIRVMWRLDARYNKTDPIPGVAPALDIEYRVVPVVLKAEYFLPVTGERVSRRWVATALRQQRKARRNIHRIHHPTHHNYVLEWPTGGEMKIYTCCPAHTPRGWDCVEA